MAKQVVKRYKRTVDPAGTDPGAAREIEELAARKKALSGLEPTPPKFGNPVKQIGGAARGVARAVRGMAKMMMPRTEMTPAENRLAKLKGERAFYEGKIEKMKGGSRYVPKTSIASLTQKRGKR